jgi:phage shock protein E
MSDLSVTEFSVKILQSGVIILDVRTPAELTDGIIKGAENLDFNSGNFETQIEYLDKRSPYAVYCRSGNRSGKAAMVMRAAGFHDVYNLDGGIIGWVNEGMPTV